MTLLLLLGAAGPQAEPEAALGGRGRGWLSMTVYENSLLSSPTMIADWSSRARNAAFETDEHGFGYLSALIQMTTNEAYHYYDSTPLSHILISDGATTVWEGRIEDRRITNEGLEIGAYGYWQALGDVYYTALWSTTSLRDWQITNTGHVSGRAPDLWRQRIDNDRLYWAPVVGETFENTTDGGGWFIEVPSQGERDITYIEFDYDITNLPTDWRLRVVAWTADFGADTVEATYQKGTDPDTGSPTITLTAERPIVELLIDDNSGGPDTPTGDTGDYWATVDNIRVKTLTQATINAEDVIGALITYTNGINSTQLSSSTARIEAQSTDLKDMTPQDRTPADIINDLATYGDNQTPPAIFTAAVWEGPVLHFHERGTYSQAWYVNAADIFVDGTINGMYNRAYARYNALDGRTLRTADADNTASQSAYGVIRETYVIQNTTNATFAGTKRDARLADAKDIRPQAELTVSAIYTASGAPAPLWAVRSGDTLTVRNMPVGSTGGVVDNIRTMYLTRTRYDVDNNILHLTPGLDPPSLDILVAQSLTR